MKSATPWVYIMNTPGPIETKCSFELSVPFSQYKHCQFSFSIRIMLSNIAIHDTFAFSIIPNPVGFYDTPYDPTSIMHYGSMVIISRLINFLLKLQNNL